MNASIRYHQCILAYILQLSAVSFSFLFLTILKLLHEPKEGIFKRDVKDKDYLYWNLRNLVKKWTLFITASNPFPWFRNRFILRFFGVKIGKNSVVGAGSVVTKDVKPNTIIVGVPAKVIKKQSKRK